MSKINLPQEYEEALSVTEQIAKAQLDALGLPPSTVLSWDIKQVVESPRHNDKYPWFEQVITTQLGPLVLVRLILNYDRKPNYYETKPAYISFIHITQLETPEMDALELWNFGSSFDRKDVLRAKLNEFGLSHLLKLSILSEIPE